LEILERLGVRKFCLELCRRLGGAPKAQKKNKGNESKQKRRKTGAHRAFQLSSIADVFGVGKVVARQESR